MRALTGTRRRLVVSACVMLLASACGGSNEPPPQQPAGTGLQLEAPWPMFRHDLQHSGRTPYEGPTAPRLRWRFSPAAPNTLSNNCPPAIAADGTIYIRSSTAVNAITAEGMLKWTFPVSERCVGSPLIAADGTIYVAGAALHALTPEGNERWQYRPMQDELGGSPAIASDGTLYICSEGYGLHALAPDGSVRWTFPIGPRASRLCRDAPEDAPERSLPRSFQLRLRACRGRAVGQQLCHLVTRSFEEM
jgi:outer membrane protein assembly factor BamB